MPSKNPPDAQTATQGSRMPVTTVELSKEQAAARAGNSVPLSTATSMVLCRVSLARTSTTPYIRPTNDFVMATTDGSHINTTTLATAIENFYIGTAGTHPVAYYLSPALDHSMSDTHTLDMYDLTGHLAGTPLGPPVFSTTFALAVGGGTTTPMPDETAVCMSYNADLTGIPEFEGKTRPAMSRRGRVYIGPLCSSALFTDTGFNPRVQTSFASDLVASGIEYLVAPLGGSVTTLHVWSRKNAALYPVIEVWVEHLFDTRRKRGARQTAARTYVEETLRSHGSVA